MQTLISIFFQQSAQLSNRQMKWFLLTIALLLGSILPTQQVSYEQKQAYFKKLLGIQQKIEDKVQSLRNINQHTISNAQSLKGQPDLQKVVLQQGIKYERQQLESAFRQTLIPLKENHWTCKNLSQSQKDLIAQKIKDLKDKTQNINYQMKSENDCWRNVEIKGSVKFLKLHIESLQNQLGNTCEPPRKDDKLVGNIDTENNCVYGTLTPKDYQQQLDELEKKYNLVNCLKDKPFLINGECVSCEKPQQIFNLSEGKCIDKCPVVTIFLKFNHQCRNPTKKEFIPQNLLNVDSTKYPYVWGPITQQQYIDKIKELKDIKIPTEECPLTKPFPSNGETCTNCPSGQVFNVGTKSCSTCKYQQKYVNEIHQCKQVYKKPNYEAGENWITENGDSKSIDKKLKDFENQNYPVEQCPADKPFPTKDLKYCVSCDKKYNLITGTCDQCSKSFVVSEGGHQCTYVTKDCEKNFFWNGEKCIKCLSPGRYDNNWRECICKSPLKYDDLSGECVTVDKNRKNPNPKQAKNYIGNAPTPNRFLDNCPQSKSFFDSANQACMQCPLPKKYFNFNTNKCEQCEGNLEFSVEKRKCVISVVIFNSNVGPDFSNYCCKEPVVDKQKENCPIGSPFFDGYHCVSCSKPQYFDFKDNQCKGCPTGKSFSTVQKTCVDSKLLEPKFVSNLPSSVTNYIGVVPEEKPNTEGGQVIKCSENKPFSNGKQCIVCELPKYFNFQTNQCQICKQGFSFSSSLRSCQPNAVVGGDLFNSNIVNAENFIGKIPDYKSQYLQCPQSLRYFNGTECVKCNLPNFWNFDKNECRQCDQGLYFDKQVRQCLYSFEGQKYKTNLEATKKIYFNGDFEQVRKDVQKSRNKTLCPSQKPFYDKSTNQCMNCEGDDNLFNFLKDRCMKCADGNHFNEENHICFQNGVEPTVERMVMNSASWI